MNQLYPSAIHQGQPRQGKDHEVRESFFSQSSGFVKAGKRFLSSVEYIPMSVVS
jgi:hypothetical protein